MQLNHIGIFNKSEKEARTFYGEFLGFENTRTFEVSPDLSEQLFSLSENLTVLVFENKDTKIEVFICPYCSQPSPDFRHSGFQVEDISSLVENARQYGVEVITGRTKEKTVHFIRDFSGNMFEIKQQ